jgi:hypothetical protein
MGRRGDFTTPADAPQRTTGNWRFLPVKLTLTLEILGNDRFLAQTNPTAACERPCLAQAESAETATR